MTRVVHFDIPIDDPERASAFYGAALGWNVERWGPVEYWILTVGREEPGAEGAMIPREDSSDGVVVYFSVADIDAAMTRVEEQGGILVTDKTPIPAVGWSAHVRDTEGNLIGLFQEDSTVELPDTGEGPPGGSA